MYVVAYGNIRTLRGNEWGTDLNHRMEVFLIAKKGPVYHTQISLVSHVFHLHKASGLLKSGRAY